MAHVKDAYYFPHDSNARNDPKLVALRSVYGSAGYGWYWIIVEMMRDQPEYKIVYNKKFSLIAIGKEIGLEITEVERFINDCISEFELFSTDGEFVWSNSLVNRMSKLKEIRRKRSDAAKHRWGETEKKKEDIEDLFADDTEKAEKEKDIFDHPEIKPAFSSYLEMRRRKKKPLTDRARKMGATELEKLTNGNIALAVKIIDQSTFKGWPGFFKLGEDGPNNDTKRAIKIG